MNDILAVVDWIKNTFAVFNPSQSCWGGIINS